MATRKKGGKTAVERAAWGRPVTQADIKRFRLRKNDEGELVNSEGRLVLSCSGNFLTVEASWSLEESERRNKRAANLLARLLLDYVDKQALLSDESMRPFDTVAGGQAERIICAKPVNRAFRFTPLWGFEMPRYWRTVQAP